MDTDTKAVLPKYRCHKEVWAVKINFVIPSSKAAKDYLKQRTAVLVPVDPKYGPIEISEEYMTKHAPEAGGYYVEYEDGYKSFSPAKAFEEGYTKI